jgi:glutaredoxin
MKATRPHITAPSCKDILNKESKYVKLLDVKSWDDITWKAEYDGNMQTAPSPYRTIHFMLTSPQSVIGVRFSPLNADNGITAGDEFELYYWDNGWQYGGSSRADYEYISFENIPINKLYWLVNTTRGREELPFIVINGKQHFVYYDILNK